MMNRRARTLGEILKANNRFDSREAILVKEIERLESRLQTLKNRLERVQNLRLQHVAKLQLNLDGISPDAFESAAA